ncbi:MAG TPA: 3-hydroxyacyl-CoA dehydrogenase family protein [Dehalococcoidales bacterium]|nr:3-hydroxyacyl-CoA dehydrogenase family protein [Dehalococcoidales bacterium]
MTAINSVLVIGKTDQAKKVETLFAKGGFAASRIDAGKGTADLVIENVTGTPGEKSKATIAGAHVGINFIFNPTEDKCLVQLVKELDTKAENVQAIKQAAEKAGAVAVVCEDVAGFIVDRVIASVVNEAAYMLETNLASMDDINKIPKVCLNWPMGPFEFADYIGIDNIVNILDAASKYGQQYLPCRTLRQMVAAGKLGRKTGRGFYEYPKAV